ncbi:hypothetical protein GLOIN_2v1814034 [Rhizophagus irregularis DAOM 181602=DAOM 197198]|uniref:RRM domain-containing protein n=1 Tax=Rhizophagus irregularis (strain DAOM 181602 / DAOM 197198 / MUCL 43194) TaxID=747089 RepID=A0A2P4P7X5_RHIID|nr:hypothetical protein GLOIN_2v1814034 [Rhizophagus irregularis DAOM 181602=DAOM 197198]POG61478.1 hypothetical protein GLOIN_2v1814034 [Rhizophagus irregularis DAOM 181602=DAOM 197198]|eukprot:XP_025168344.1 hypothetical protein GLOIN_2v1814034 [Rhizophagus irregularis DAOM 181602=DAOM 197198]
MGRSSYPCCYTTKLSIFFGGEYSDELEEIKAITIADFLKNTLQFPFKHIKKKDDWGFGFVHFENEVERDNFFNYVKEQSFTGSRGKILNFNRAKAKKVHYRDDDIEVQPLLHIPSQSQSETLQSQTSQSQTSQMQLQLQLQTSQTSQSQTSQSQLQTSPQYNIFESSDELIVYIQAITVEKNSIEIETNNFEARNIYVKFKYNQEIEAGLQCKKGSFHILKDEIEISIHLPKRYLKYPSRNISSNIKQNTINTSSSKIPQISQSIPKIHLPKSVANLPKLSRQPLDETERDLKVENEKLKAHVEELETKLNKIFLELKETQDLNETLIAINEEFRKKNDDLYKKLEIYKNLRKPSIVEKGKSTRKHARYHHMNFISFKKHLHNYPYLPMLGQMNIKENMKKKCQIINERKAARGIKFLHPNNCEGTSDFHW